MSFLPSHRTTVSSAAATTTGTLYLELSSQPSDYSYFKSDIMSTWAGPQHWKLRSRFSKGTALFLSYHYRHHLNNTPRNGTSIFRVLAKKSFVICACIFEVLNWHQLLHLSRLNWQKLTWNIYFVGLKFDLCKMKPFDVWDSYISVIPFNSETEMFGPLLQFNTNFCTSKLNPTLTLAFSSCSNYEFSIDHWAAK